MADVREPSGSDACLAASTAKKKKGHNKISDYRQGKHPEARSSAQATSLAPLNGLVNGQLLAAPEPDWISGGGSECFGEGWSDQPCVPLERAWISAGADQSFTDCRRGQSCGPLECDPAGADRSFNESQRAHPCLPPERVWNAAEANWSLNESWGALPRGLPQRDPSFSDSWRGQLPVPPDHSWIAAGAGQSHDEQWRSQLQAPSDRHWIAAGATNRFNEGFVGSVMVSSSARDGPSHPEVGEPQGRVASSRSGAASRWQADAGEEIAGVAGGRSCYPEAAAERGRRAFEQVPQPAPCTSKALVLVLGLPKCGTTSLHRAFESAGFASEHWALGVGKDSHADVLLRKKGQDADRRMIAKLMYRAACESLPLLSYMPPDCDAVAEMNGLFWEDSHNAWGFFPQMSLLERLVEQYPYAHFILNVRDSEKWVKSVKQHSDMQARLAAASLPGLPRGVGWHDHELVKWASDHHTRVRELLTRLRLRFLEFHIEQDGAQELCEFLGRNVEWGQHNVTQ